MSMISTRTEYRAKRLFLIIDSISRLSNILILEKRQIERIKLPLLKKINEQVQESENQARSFHSASKKES